MMQIDVRSNTIGKSHVKLQKQNSIIMCMYRSSMRHRLILASSVCLLDQANCPSAVEVPLGEDQLLLILEIQLVKEARKHP